MIGYLNFEAQVRKLIVENGKEDNISLQMSLKVLRKTLLYLIKFSYFQGLKEESDIFEFMRTYV